MDEDLLREQLQELVATYESQRKEIKALREEVESLRGRIEDVERAVR